MLPTHVFADVVRCFRLYDLDALLMTDARCKDLAVSAASRIRVFDFSEFYFSVCGNEVEIYKTEAGHARWFVAELKFLTETDLNEFITAAFRNCVVGSPTILSKSSVYAVSAVADTVVIKDGLCLTAVTYVNASALAKFAVSFRNVEACFFC